MRYHVKKVFLFTLFFTILFPRVLTAQEGFETDVIKTSAGDLEITFIGHGTLMLNLGGKIIHVDPWTRLGDYSKMPKADLILFAHEPAVYNDAGNGCIGNKSF